MEKTIKRIKSKQYWIIAFLLGSLAAYVMLSYSQLLTTGKYILLTRESLDYIANIRMYAGNILHGELVWYSFASFLGTNIVANLAGTMFSPFNILYILFYKVDVNVITAVIIILKMGLAATTFQVFASKTLKIRNYYSILFAVFYSACSFSILYGIVNFIWLDGLYVLPVAALATEKAVREARYFLLTIVYAYIFIVQMHQGYLIVTFSLLYFLLLIGLMKKSERKLPVWKHIVKYLLSLSISVLIASFLFVPVFLFLQSNDMFSIFTKGTGTTLMQVFNNFFWGEVQNFTIAPYVYCGIPCLLLIPFYFINSKIAIRERIVYGLLLGFFSIACIAPSFLSFFQVFENVEMWNYRFAFVISFLVCAIACKEVLYIKYVTLKGLLLYVIFLVLFFIVEGRLERIEIGNASHNNLLGLGINFGFITLWIAVTYLYIRSSKFRMTISILFVFLVLFECVSNGVLCLSSDAYRNMVKREEYYYMWVEDMKYTMNEIEKNEDENSFYRIVVKGDYNNNGDAFWNYKGITDYDSYENKRINDFLEKMGLYIEKNRLSATGITLPMEMLLSVRYIVQLYSDMEVLGYDAKPNIQENKDVLPIAFMADEAILENMEVTNNSFENQNRVFMELSGVDQLYIPVDQNLITTDTDGLLLTDDDKPVLYTDNTGNGVIVFRVSNTDNPVYMQIASSVQREDIQNIYYDNSENMMFYDDNCAWVPFVAKLWQSGDNHYLSLRVSETSSVYFPTEGIYLYELNMDKMREIADSLRKGSFHLEKYNNGYLKGSVSVKDNKRVLFTSIPYDAGWKAVINNKKVECVPVLNGTFLGIVLPDIGDYEIEFRYHCPGANIGGVISLFGIAFLIVLFLSERRKNVKNNYKEQL